VSGNGWRLYARVFATHLAHIQGAALISQKSVGDGSYRPLQTLQQQTMAVAEAC